jgi:hypothetical protein
MWVSRDPDNDAIVNSAPLVTPDASFEKLCERAAVFRILSYAV